MASRDFGPRRPAGRHRVALAAGQCTGKRSVPPGRRGRGSLKTRTATVPPPVTIRRDNGNASDHHARQRRRQSPTGPATPPAVGNPRNNGAHRYHHGRQQRRQRPTRPRDDVVAQAIGENGKGSQAHASGGGQSERIFGSLKQVSKK
jgi:hypothetical protein